MQRSGAEMSEMSEMSQKWSVLPSDFKIRPGFFEPIVVQKCHMCHMMCLFSLVHMMLRYLSLHTA